MENRLLLASDWQNPITPLDTNLDGEISPADALTVVNDLNLNGARPLTELSGEGEGGGAPRYAVDVNGDGSASAADVLSVINFLNGEGENGPVVEFHVKVFDLTRIDILSNGTGFFDGAAFEISDFNTVVSQLGGRAPRSVKYEFEDPSQSQGTFDPDAQPVLIETGDNGATPSTTTEIAMAIADAISAANAADDTNVTATATGSQVVLNNDFSSSLEGSLQSRMRFTRREITADSNPTVGLNQEVLVKVFVQDIRMGTRNGVFAAYLDVLYDGQQVSLVENAFVQENIRTGVDAPTSILHNQLSYGNDPDGVTTIPDRLDKVGSFAASTSFLDGSEFLLWQAKFSADETGMVTFMGEPTTDADDPFDAGQSPDRDTGIFGQDDPVCPSVAECRGELSFVDATITIVADVVANPDIATVAENGAVNIDVLANDTVFSPPNTDPQLVSFAQPANGSVTTGPNNTLRYAADPAFFGTDTFTYIISNGQGATDTGTVTVTVTPINDPPVNNVPGSQTVAEDTPLNFTGANAISVSDLDGDVDLEVTLSADNGSLTVTVGSGVTVTGNGGSNVVIEGALSDVNSTLGTLVYLPDQDFNGSDTVTVVSDDMGNVGGGPLMDTDTIGINVTAVNDAPVIGGAVDQTAIFFVDTLTFSSNDGNALSVTDVDANQLSVTIDIDQGGVFTLGSTAGLQVTGNGTDSLTISGAPQAITAGLENSEFDPDDTFVGDATVTIVANDNGQTGAGGAKTTTESFAIPVVPPRRPFAVTDRFNVDEGMSLTFDDTDLLDNDLFTDDVQTREITQFQMTTSNGGTVVLNGSTFTYTPANDDFFGVDVFTYTIDQEPKTGEYEGPSTGTVRITVEAVNDAPVLTVPAAQQVNEDESLDFGSSIDVSDADGDVAISVTLSVNEGLLTASPDGATLQGNNSASVVITGLVSQVNDALDGLTYIPAENFAGSDTLSISVDDMGNIGKGTQIVTGSVGITVNAVNDAPVVTVPSLANKLFITNTDNLLSSDGVTIRVQDLDAGNADIRLSLTVSEGTLTPTSTAGLTSTTGAGTSMLTLVGSQTEINAALQSGIIHRATVAANVTLTATVNDLGNLGSGGEKTDTESTTFEVIDFVASTLGGRVYVDGDKDRIFDEGERPLGGVKVTLAGTDFRNNSVNRTVETDGTGRYVFDDIQPGLYTITQDHPSHFIDGPERFQSPVFPTSHKDQGRVQIGMSGGVTSMNNDFTEVGLEAIFFDGIDLTTPAQEGDAGQPDGPLFHGLLFGLGDGASWWTLQGDQWDGFSNPQIELDSDLLSATITVVDGSGNTRTAVVTHDSARLRIRSEGDRHTVRIIGRPSELFTNSSASSEGEAESDALAANTPQSAQQFAEDVDALMAAMV